MLERCRQHHISLNLKKCAFCAPFGILLGHIVCKEGMLVDPSNIVVIFDLQEPITVKQLSATLGHIGLYLKFIRRYIAITAPMENLLKKYVKLEWDDEC